MTSPLPALLLALATQDPAPRLERVELPRGFVAEVQIIEDEGGRSMRHGTLEVRDAGGVLRAEGQYEAGRRRGRWRFFHAGGTVLAVGGYVDGRRSGTWSFDRADGQRWFKGKYKDGFPSGPWTAWGPGGETDPLHTGRYEPLVDVELGAGQRGTGLLLDGELHGRWTTTWPNGRPQLEATYARGLRTGRWDFWHVDGTHDPDFLDREPEERPDASPWCRAILEDPVPVDVELPGLGMKEEGELPDPRAILECLEAEGIDPLVVKDFESCADPGKEWKGFGLELERLPALRDLYLRLAVRALAQAELDAEPIPNRTVRLMQVACASLPGEFILWVDKSRYGHAYVWRRAVLRLHALHALTERVETWWSFEARLMSMMAGNDVARGVFPLHIEALATNEPPELYASRFVRRDPVERTARPALNLALAWLARHQDEDGSWDCDGFMKHCPPTDTEDGPGKPEHDVGVTGLALLALLGDGNTIREGPYRENVRRAVHWLLEQQDYQSGLLGHELGAFVYDHAIGTLALVEAYHTSGVRALGRQARKAVVFIHRARNPYGVWHYEVPPVGDSDSSITIWMLQALAAAREAGLPVDDQCFVDTLQWYEAVTDHASGRGGYSQMGEGSARVPGVNEHYPPFHTPAMTAAALYASAMLGQEPDDPLQEKRSGLILRSLPDASNPKEHRDYYYWYHATQGMQHLHPKLAKIWRDAILDTLLELQKEDGPWAPDGAWGFAGGRVYSTALGALMLEAPKRHAQLPLGR